MTTQIAPPGLKGLAVSDTELGSVRGEEGFFHYRQYDAVQLARTRTLEEVWTLQVEGGPAPGHPRHRSRPDAGNTRGSGFGG